MGFNISDRKNMSPFGSEAYQTLKGENTTTGSRTSKLD